MKKAIALLVAVVAAFSINVSAFAALGTDMTRSLEWAGDTSDANPKVSVEKNQLVLGYSANGGPVAVLPETFLQPGNEYTYQLYRVDQDYTSVEPNQIAMTPVSDTVLDGGKLKIRTVKGSANVVSAKIEKKGSGAGSIYNFKIETKETYGTKINDLEYNVVVTGQSANGERILDANIQFQTGYRAMTDEDIDYYDEGDLITIMRDRPVITKKQFETLAKNYNYKAISFTGEDGDWTFTGRVSGMGDANFLTTYDVAPEIIIAYPEQDYKFITFNAGVTFPTNGELRLDVSDIADSNINPSLYAYLYRNGTLTPISTTYDSTNTELVFRTNYLGTFVITDTEITDTSIVGNEENPTPEEPAVEEPETPPVEGETGNNTGNNPNTGMDATMNLLATLGLAAIGGGTAIRKRK